MTYIHRNTHTHTHTHTDRHTRTHTHTTQAGTACLRVASWKECGSIGAGEIHRPCVCVCVCVCVSSQLTFALFSGILTPAVIATRNAFVLHQLDKVRECLHTAHMSLVPYNTRLMRTTVARACCMRSCLCTSVCCTSLTRQGGLVPPRIIIRMHVRCFCVVTKAILPVTLCLCVCVCVCVCITHLLWQACEHVSFQVE